MIDAKVNTLAVISNAGRQLIKDEAVKLADDSRRVALEDIRQWAEERFKVACGLVRTTTIQRQKWQQRGRAEILRDLLHHLDSLAKTEGTA